MKVLSKLIMINICCMKNINLSANYSKQSLIVYTLIKFWLFVCNHNPAKVACKIFIRTTHLKCSNLENKAISSQICNLWGLQFYFLNHLRYNGNNDEMLIRILCSFLNRSINIIMDHCYNKSPISSQVI